MKNNLLIIVAHPLQNSFDYSIFEEVEWFCRGNDFSYNKIDLYREDFDPLVRDEKTLFIREILIDKRMVENYQQMIEAASLVIIISPLNAFRCATMLEGFFDKVVLTKKYSGKKILCFLSTNTSNKLEKIVERLISFIRLKLGVLDKSFGKNNFIHFCNTSSNLKNDLTLERDKVIREIRKRI